MKHKIALISDIHGNTTALKSVIDDMKNEHITDTWVLGDVIMQGPGAEEVFELLYSLKPSIWVKGNWDDLLLASIDKELDPKYPTNVYITMLGIDLSNRLSMKNINFLRTLPLHDAVELNGLNISVSHNFPHLNYGRALIPTGAQEDFDKLFISDTYDIAVYGHVHHQLMRYSSTEQLIINPGSVGYPFSARKNLRREPRAQYAILEVDESGVYEINFKQIKYDVEAEVKCAYDIELPYADLYKNQLIKGTSRTHDQEFLKVLNLEDGYLNQVKEYLK